MYRGKFANNQGGRSAEELVRERTAQEQSEKMRAAQQRAAQAARQAAQRPVQQPRMNPQAPQMGRAPAAQMPPQAGRAPVAQMPPRPMPRQAAAPMPQKSHRKGTVTFYCCYFGFILVFCAATFFGLTWLKGWLQDYEAAQPDVMAEAVFQQLFADPNWGLLYDNSTAKSTDLEGKDSYVAYMEEKVGSSQLTYQETSAGLSGDKKYFVKLGDERIASFTLIGESEFITDIPDWQLGPIDLMLHYDNSYRIQLQEGHKATVNGMELDESYTIMKASTVAQNFLPEGVSGIRMWTQQIDNLMGKPTVKITDEKGQEMQVEYDAETMTFIEQTQANTISEDQKAAAIGAAQVYGKYMISQANRGDLAKYFDASSDIYTTIRTSEKIVQKAFFKSYDFGTKQEVTEFVMYSDDLFSCHVSLVLNVTRKDDTIKEFPIDTNLFFSKQSTGKWLAYDMTNEPVLEPVGQVRLTFMNGDQQVATDFYDTAATELDTPLVSIPEGKVFSGWTRETKTEEGQTVLEVMFTPDETGHVVLPAKNVLEPMVLTALFEDAPAEGGA